MRTSSTARTPAMRGGARPLEKSFARCRNLRRNLAVEPLMTRCSEHVQWSRTTCDDELLVIWILTRRERCAKTSRTDRGALSREGWLES